MDSDLIPADLRGLAPGKAVRRVSLLRHAEKEGREQPTRLSSTGRLRAFALPYLLQDLSRRDGWPWAPDCLIAARDTSRSQRPSLTLVHLAHRLGLPVHQCRTPGEAVTRLFGPDPPPDWRHAVVVWRHTRLLAVARALGAPPDALPDQWPAELYDRIVLLDYDARGRLVRVRCLLADDELELAGPEQSTVIDCSAEQRVASGPSPPR
ncbi:hypothetical protein [Tahibacter caeni]|uniref:hypothetical protein n=1 Tax=Tahibacter caeni TaxID=1453545 RepID=UPI002148CDEB|nr:hypothetical protein [Tahibacter caeni]